MRSIFARRALARRAKISLRAKTCPPLRAKIFRFAFDPNQTYSFHRPGPQEGRIAIVTDVGMGCGGRGSVRCNFSHGRMMLQRTAKSCGSGAPMQALTERNDPLMTVAIKHGHREEHEGNR
jgi:hypothetical protein